MGEAYVALADDSSSIFWNPAGLAKMNFPEILYMHNQWFIDISQRYFDVAYPADFGTFGVSYSLLDSGDIQGYSATGSIEAAFKAQDSALTFAWARKVNDKLSFGLGLKSISETLENNRATAVALDLGILYDLNYKLSFGAAVQNVGQPLKFDSEETPLPQTYRAGLGYRDRIFSQDFSLGLDFIKSGDSAFSMNAGMEYLIRNFLALRAGSSKSGLRAGVGIKVAYFSLDYAYLSQNDLGATHQVSMSYSFGTEEKKQALILERLTLGRVYYDDKKYSDAIIQFRKAFDLEPENAEARAMLIKANKALKMQAEEEARAEERAEEETEVYRLLANGKKFMAEKQYLEAITEFNKVLKILPSHPDAVSLMREAQEALGVEVSEKVKEEAREHLGLALKYITTENYAEALQEVGEVLKIDPGNVEALKLYKKLKKILEIENE
ncbi:MAG: PorV/PorQ family protein, partial [Candidatus Margulisiibacteriota bacterium]